MTSSSLPLAYVRLLSPSEWCNGRHLKDTMKWWNENVAGYRLLPQIVTLLSTQQEKPERQPLLLGSCDTYHEPAQPGEEKVHLLLLLVGCRTGTQSRNLAWGTEAGIMEDWWLLAGCQVHGQPAPYTAQAYLPRDDGATVGWGPPTLLAIKKMSQKHAQRSKWWKKFLRWDFSLARYVKKCIVLLTLDTYMG